MQRRWKLRPCATDAEAEICRELGLSSLIGRLLASRGLGRAAEAAAFLEARLSEHLRSPQLFRQMPRAASRVVAALRAGERIAIHGDYDVDGMSGSAILIRFLRELGHDPLLHIPHRLRDGYGVTEPGVRHLAAAGARLMITVDCGAVSHREIELARGLGMETIVCDHHQVSETPLPAHAVLNPLEADAGFPFRGLCGAGLAFYLALGIRQQLRSEGIAPLPDLRRCLELVALGTIADVVPLVEENRVLVKHGLRQLERTTSPGLMALKSVSGVSRVSSGTVGFRLAPRLNASGRLDDATRGVELLTTEASGRAEELAAALEDENRTRQDLEREMLREAVAEVERGPALSERRGIVLASPDWHPGVIGIVAARLAERYYRPTVLIALRAESGTGRGSGRSIPGVNLHRCFRECGHLLEGFGGHEMAAGLSIRADQLTAFSEHFEAAVRSATQRTRLLPTRMVDAELLLDEVDESLIADLDRLEPYGQGNPQPVFLARGVTVITRRVVGETHLKLLLRQGKRRLPAIAFGMASASVAEQDVVDVLYSPEHNEWNGTSTVEMRIVDLRPHDGTTASRSS